MNYDDAPLTRDELWRCSSDSWWIMTMLLWLVMNYDDSSWRDALWWRYMHHALWLCMHHPTCITTMHASCITTMHAWSDMHYDDACIMHYDYACIMRHILWRCMHHNASRRIMMHYMATLNLALCGCRLWRNFSAWMQMRGWNWSYIVHYEPQCMVILCIMSHSAWLYCALWSIVNGCIVHCTLYDIVLWCGRFAQLNFRILLMMDIYCTPPTVAVNAIEYFILR